MVLAVLSGILSFFCVFPTKVVLASPSYRVRAEKDAFFLNLRVFDCSFFLVFERSGLVRDFETTDGEQAELFIGAPISPDTLVFA